MHATTRAVSKGLTSVLLLAVVGFAGCSGSSGAPTVLLPAPAEPRLESARTVGDADALAGELLVSAGIVQPSPLRPAVALADPQLASAVAAIAFDHLRSVGYGAGTGPSVEGSRRVQRLALAANAPPDANSSGSNRDEALRADLDRLAAAAGAAELPEGLLQPLLPWAEASADLAAPPTGDASGVPTQWRTVPGVSRVVRLADVAAAMQGRVRAISRLIDQRRGSLVGATAADGLEGLLLLSQVVAAEEELVGALTTDGSTLGGYDDVHAYDPAQGLRWLPAEVETLESGDGAAAYRARDLASDLVGLAAILDATAELAWFSGTGNPSAAVRAVFTGPFAPPPVQNPPTPRLNWQQNVRPIINAYCSGCHSGFATGGFLCDTYASTLLGSPRTRTFGPMVVPGNHAASFLHRILTAPPFPVQRMPPGFSPLPSASLLLIDTWIDQGALENPEVLPPPPSPGQDLATATFANLVAMHLHRSTGAVHSRNDGTARSGVATSASTGRTLTALAHAFMALPNLASAGLGVSAVLQLVASFAAQNLVGADGRCLEQLDLTTFAPGRPAGLGDQAVLVAGLFDAARITAQPNVRAAAVRAAAALLTSFRDVDHPWFREVPEHAFARYSPRVLADVLAALRAATAAGQAGAAVAHDQLVARLLPTLAYSSWTGTAGLPAPALAGGPFGRLPVLAGAILVGSAEDPPPADGPVTWSQHVRPLLLGKCGECHCNGSNQGGYRCDTVDLLATPGGQNGERSLLVPGDAEASFFYRKLVDRLPASGAQMPLQRSLLDERARELVRRWIESGASRR